MAEAAGAHVAILMATRNGARFLPDQLRSLTCQRHRDWSLVVSDDGSEDETPQLLRRFAACYPGRDIGIHEGPCRGACANFLSMLSRVPAQADFVALCDQDDLWMPDRLSRGLRALSGLPQGRAGLFGAHSLLVDNGLRRIARPAPPRGPPGFENALVQNVVAGNTMLLNRAALELLLCARPHPLPPFHDWWIYALLAGAASEVILDPAPVLLYRQHGGNLLGAHRGAAARLRRAGLLARGRYRRWLGAHLAALASARHCLAAENRERLDTLLRARVGGLSRARAFRNAGVRRDTPLGTGVLHASAVLGLA